MEIWAIDSSLNTIQTFVSFDDADDWYKKNVFHQILYRVTEQSPIHVYVSYNEYVNFSIPF